MQYPHLDSNVHLTNLQTRFGDLAVTADGLADIDQVILLCFTNRSGSNYLAAGLASDGHLNLAQEILNAEFVAEHAHEATFAGFLASECRSRQVNGRFILKVGVAHLEIMGEAGLLDLWRDRLQFVFIERTDRLAQAISWEIAVQSGQWLHDAAPMADPVYDRGRVLAAIDYFAECNGSFDVFFGANGIVPAHVLYEELDADPESVVSKVGRAIGLPDLRLDPARIELRRQAGRLNAEWRARFLDGQ